MNKIITIELCGIHAPINFKKEIELEIDQSTFNLVLKESSRLSGLETFIIMVSSQISTYIIIKTIEFCHKSLKTEGKIINSDTGKEISSAEYLKTKNGDS